MLGEDLKRLLFAVIREIGYIEHYGQPFFVPISYANHVRRAAVLLSTLTHSRSFQRLTKLDNCSCTASPNGLDYAFTQDTVLAAMTHRCPEFNRRIMNQQKGDVTKLVVVDVSQSDKLTKRAD